MVTTIPNNLIHLQEIIHQHDAKASEDAIVRLLQSRFKADQPYTRLGSHGLIVVNPYKSLELLDDATLAAYGQYGYKDISSMDNAQQQQLQMRDPEPHVFEMATRIYLLMRRRSENQAILLSGLSRSGKSTTHRHLLKELLYLSTHTRKEGKVGNQIIGVNTIFESFGTTTATTASSCLGQFQTLQFNERGRIIGCNTNVFLLDKYKLNNSSYARYSTPYTVFYQLLAGTTADEKQALHIQSTSSSHFNYLNSSNSKQQRNVQADLMAFNELKNALKLCGFKTKTVAQMCQLLAAILHLGNIQFVDGNKHLDLIGKEASSTNAGSTSGGSESCRIKNKEILTLVAAALGVATSKLEITLTHKLKLIGNEFCTAFLTIDSASQQRDALAHTLYSVLVLWIMNALNQKLDMSEKSIVRTISILDTVGLQPPTNQQHPRAAVFHDLCVNYASEKIRQYMFDLTFSPTSTKNTGRVEDGLMKSLPPYRPSTSCLSLYHGTEGNGFALIPLMNKESKRFQSYALDATDSQLLSTLFQQKKKKEQQSPGKNDYVCFLSPSTLSHSFAIRHYDTTQIDYSIDGFLESNVDAISPDFIHLFKYNCTNAFVHELFETGPNSLSGWITEIHPRDERTVIKAQLPIWPPIGPQTAAVNAAMTEKTLVDEKQVPKKRPTVLTVLDQVVAGTESLIQTLNTMRVSTIIHIEPNPLQKPDTFDTTHVQYQLRMLKITQIAHHTREFDSMYGYTFSDFATRYKPLMDDDTMMESESDITLTNSESCLDKEEESVIRHRVQTWVSQLEFDSATSPCAELGSTQVWLSFDLWRTLENKIRSIEKEARLREKERLAAIEAKKEAIRLAAIEAALEAQEFEAAQKAAAEAEAAARAAEIAAIAADRSSSSNGRNNNPFLDNEDCWSVSLYEEEDCRTEKMSQFDTIARGEGEEVYGNGLSEGFGPNLDMSKMMEDYSVHPEEQVEEVSITRIRYWWSNFVFFSTWWIPSFTLKYFGKMTREDVQMAWREKVTLCLLIFAFSGSIIFFIVGLGAIICPGTKDLYSAEDVSSHQTISDYWVSVRGKVYDVTGFVSTDHGTSVYMAGKSNLDPLAGRDLSYTFPPPLTIACNGLVNDPSVQVMPNETIVLGPFIHFSGPQQQERSLDKLRDPYWLNKYFGPTMNLYKRGDLVIPMKQIKDDYTGWGRLIVSIDEHVYDLTDYMATARRYPSGGQPGVPNFHYLDPMVETLFTKFGGKDATSEWNKYSAAMDEQTRTRNKACLDNAFYIGRLDYRESIRCTFVNYLLLSFAVVMSVVILVKFLAALQFGSAPTPEDHDKFVICQVPCYTEDEESLRKTIDSLTAMTYDDNHKLLFLIADGMIIGSGNDRPTPRILLDILGHDEQDDPEALMFKSIGEGSKQLNYGKVYSGVYQHEGHLVPYVVVVKVGKSSERAKPGNRGKRDSQIICMNFLNKVHFDSEMSPLELEIYYHIKHIIGIDPSFYEYILMVDSDTEVYPDALNRLISCMLHDSRIIGLCGETELGNEDRSWTTMIQVYEYYISHHLVKSFESLFGSVTCLPGCFCMYRIRTASKHQPLIVSPNVIHAYSDNQVDTLHKKNLLHLGEDRYLTTLMMKNFPEYKMMFTPYAKCRTVAPDQWRVLLSQRRRWINSTIHNLLELILLQELCGFCCLSMRFVVMTDLIGTITLPSSVIYLIYLFYQIISGSGPIPTIALGMLAGAYGLQSLIFIFKRQWQHIGWMVIYILAIPIFSFFIPLYAFWHFDDFSWGNTRVVVGDKKKQIIVTDDEKFDEKMIPLKKWAVHEQEMWETKTLRSEATMTHKSCHSVNYRDDYSQARSIASSHRSYRRGSDGGYEGGDLRTMRSHSSIGTTNRSNCSVKDHYRPHSHQLQYQQQQQQMNGSSQLNSQRQQQQQQSLLPPVFDSSEMGQFSVDLTSVLRPKTITHEREEEESSTKIAMLPEDDEIEREIRAILTSSDLTTLTKKQVRDRLSELFGVDLNIKKGFINKTIERLL